MAIINPYINFMKKIINYIAISIVVIIMIFVLISRYKKSEIAGTPTSGNTTDTCYEYYKDTSSGFPDRAWLKMSITGDNVTGEYQNLPSEKDSKVGKFSGTIGKMDSSISGRIADVWWDSMAEGMSVKEQLKIQLGAGSAVALFGEMVDKGDGIYVYKDSSKLTPGFQMPQINCASLDDKIIVEKYIRLNINTITPQKPVLGGLFYITRVNINPSIKTGTMTYEDGHFQSKASFNYLRNNEEVSISSVKTIK